MGLDKIRFFSLFCFSVVIFVCISNIQSTAHLDYKLYYTFLLVLLFSPKLFELWDNSGGQPLKQANENGAVNESDEGAAPTGFKEPTMPNVKTLDLPDKKKFDFVRTKTDNDVATANRKNVGEEKCLENLIKFGSPTVFLISSHFLERFDFQKLVDKLVDDLPDQKKHAMIMSLPVYSKQSLKKCAWAVAFTSGGITAIPVALVVPFLTKCYHSFGLDDGTLQKLSDRVNKPILKEVKKSVLVREIAKN